MEIDYSKIKGGGFPGPPSRVYLVTGADDALKAEAVKRLVSSLIDDASRDFDFEERDVPVSGVSDDGHYARELVASANSAPFSADRRVVVATNIQRLRKTDIDELAEALSTLCELSSLILVAGAPEYDAGKVKASTAVPAKLVTAASKQGTIVKCGAPETGDLKTRLHAAAAAQNKTVEPAALELLVQWSISIGSARGGAGKTGDLNAALNELQKVIDYVGDRERITRDDAAAVSLQGSDDNVFRLLDAVTAGDAKLALSCADDLLRAGDKADAVLARTLVMLARQFRLLWAAKLLAEQGINRSNAGRGVPEDVQMALSAEAAGMVAQGYRLQALQTHARSWTTQSLTQAMTRIAEADCTMKGIPAQPALGLKPRRISLPGEDLRLLTADLCHLSGMGRNESRKHPARI